MTERKPNGYWTKENTIAEAKCVVERHGADNLNQSWLGAVGRSSLAFAIAKHGGYPWIRQELGIGQGMKPSGYWTKENTIKEATVVVEQYGPDALKQLWLSKNGFGGLNNAIGLHGGYAWIREEAGLEEGPQKPSGYWTKENVINEARAVAEQHGVDALTKRWLDEHGRGDLSSAIKKQGGMPWVRAELGMGGRRVKPSGYWTKENVLKEFRLILEEHGPDAAGEEVLRNLGHNGLIHAIRRHGGYAWLREQLDLEPTRAHARYWTVANTIKVARAVVEQRMEGDPVKEWEKLSSKWLTANGHSSLAKAIEKHGGYYWIRKELGIPGYGTPGCYWTAETATAEARAVVERHGPEALKSEWLAANGYGGLAVGISKNGGFAWMRGQLEIASPVGKFSTSKTSTPYRRAINLERIKAVVRDLNVQGAAGFTPAQMIVLFQQSGLDKLPLAEGGDIFKRITKGSLLPKELIDFSHGDEPEPPTPPAPGGTRGGTQPSEPDDPAGPAAGPTAPVEPPAEPPAPVEPAPPAKPGEDLIKPEDLPDLMVMDPLDQLRFIDAPAFAGADDEAIEALISMSLHQLWAKAYLGEEHEAQVVEACRSFHPERPYSKRVQDEFLRQHAAARALQLPDSYRFEVEGKPAAPLLMQLHVAALAAERRRLLVLSAMGTGKSLAAQLAVMSDGAKRILVLPLNSCTHQWAGDFRRDWSGVTVHTEAKRIQQGHDGQLLRVLQTPELSAGTNVWVLPLHLMSHLEDQDVAEIVEAYRPDAVIIDEVQFVKQRLDDQESTRREQSRKLLCLATAADPNLMVLALSGTAVVNNLTEARKLLELLLCEERPDLKVEVGPSNAMKMHQALMAYGIRQKPAGEFKVQELRPEIDASDLLDRIRIIHRARVSNVVLKTEQILLEAKLPTIVRAAASEPTIVATQFVEGIVEPILEALERSGRRVGVYTGSDKYACYGHKDAVEAFKAGAIDVLIGSISTLGTGLDKLQHACSNLVVATMPWTAADYQQLVARLARKGQQQAVTVTIPTTYLNYWSEKDGLTRWSYCDYRYAVVESKARLLDAVMDGLIPADSSELNASKAKRWISKWMERLEESGALVRVLRPITVPLVFRTESEEIKARRHYGDFSSCNGRWNAVDSGKLHTRLQANPQEWELYHTDLEKLRLNWSVDPLQEAINFLAQSKGLVVGDFGCGTAQLAEALRGRHTVHSFDHIAINDSVVACDIAAGVPLEDSCLDYAVFSLSLMGSNWRAQLVEAWRCLKPTGQLLIWTAAGGKEQEEFTAQVERAGFKAITTQAHDRWLHLWAARTAEATITQPAR